MPLFLRERLFPNPTGGIFIVLTLLVCSAVVGVSRARSEPQSVMVQKFVKDADGNSLEDTPPAASYTTWLNENRDSVLTERAPRWSDNQSQISGHGTFTVELGNFPTFSSGDSVTIRFTDTRLGQQGRISLHIDTIPWSDSNPFTALELNEQSLPARPDSVQLSITNQKLPQLEWNVESGLHYSVYRRSFEDILFNGELRFLYTKVADSLDSGNYTDTTAAPGGHYGYILLHKIEYS